jgi:hypothetical protein
MPASMHRIVLGKKSENGTLDWKKRSVGRPVIGFGCSLSGYYDVFTL